MKTALRMTAWVAVMALCIPAGLQAQAPQPKLSPQLTLSWLHSVSISPSTVTRGGQATGTVTLLRPAVADMVVAISIAGGTEIEGGLWMLDGNLVSNRANIAAGSDRGTFHFYSSAQSPAKSYTIVARYAKESKSTAVAVVR